MTGVSPLKKLSIFINRLLIENLNLKTENLKIAIYYDWLNQWGGAERVLLDILKLYPHADIFTLDYDPQKTPWLPKNRVVYSLNLKNKLLYTPFYSFALEKIDFSNYDILISTTSHVGHSFLTLPSTLFICYFHNVNRYLYQHSPPLLKGPLKKYRKSDYIYGQRPDYLLCNSRTVASRIKRAYGRSAKVIYPGIDTKKFIPNKLKPKKYFLIVSRLVSHKNIDLAIQAFSKLPYKLKIVGIGRNQNYLKKIASPYSNIIFLDSVGEKKLLSLYQNCQALIHPQEEDFGLTALEVQACGRGVIAYQKGGATETVIKNQTGVFFNQATPESLRKAVEKYLSLDINSQSCRTHALRFDHHLFMLHFKQTVDHLWQQKIKTTT